MERFEDFERSTEQPDEFDEAVQRNFRSTDAPLPPAHGEAHDVTVTDDRGWGFTLRTEDGTSELLIEAREKDQGHISHPVRIRMYHGGQEAGRVNVTLEVDKAYSEATKHFDRIAGCRLRVNDIKVHRPYRGHGVGTRMLERAEDVARQGRASEIYGTVEKPEVRHFFESNGHQIRPHADGGEEHYKNPFG